MLNKLEPMYPLELTKTQEPAQGRLKILVSAFACQPNAGSEGGVGWRWSEEWAREHDVVVITDISRRNAIEAHLASQPCGSRRFVFFRPRWLAFLPLNSITAQILYQFWQIGLLSFVKRLNREEGFDLAHHVSYGVFRQPSLIGHAGIPLVFGPVGGGEDAPGRLKRSLSPSERLREGIRGALNRFARIDPLLRWGLDGCALILAKTAASAKALPDGVKGRTEVALEIGTVPREGVAPRAAPIGRPLRLMYAGRLLGWKGIHLGLAALARAREAGVQVEFHVVGSGPYEARLRSQAESLGIADRVRWFSAVPQEVLFTMYRETDAVLFPSLHDSSGNVVMEALSFALPVICLDLGGPGDIVTDDCGYVVRTAGLDETGVVAELATGICSLSHDGAAYARLSAGALRRSVELDWSTQVNRIKGMAMACRLKSVADGRAAGAMR